MNNKLIMYLMKQIKNYNFIKRNMHFFIYTEDTS